MNNPVNLARLSRQDWDAIIVGSGAGGATTALRLAEAGWSVLMLEEGGRHSEPDFRDSISDQMGTLYRDAGMTPILGRPNIAFAEGCCVGGSTVINGALLWRTPANLLANWRAKQLPGLEEAVLNPIFDRLDRDLSIATQPDRTSNRASWKLTDAASALGWHHELAPRGQAGCRNTNRCPTGCPTGAKQSMLVSYIPRAEAAGAEVVSGIRVERLGIAAGKVTGVSVTTRCNGAQSLDIAARSVILCGGAVQTPFLLRRSGIRRNVGSLALHLNIKVVAIFDEDLDPARGTIMAAQVKEFSDRHLYLGSSNFHPAYLAMTLAPQGAETVERVMQHWRNSAVFVAQIRASGRGSVGSSPSGGKAAARYQTTQQDVEQIHFGLERMAELLFMAGAKEIFLPYPGLPPLRDLEQARRAIRAGLEARRLDLLSVHVMASCPMSANRSSGATDPYGRVWDVNGLYLNDASVLPEATGVNPQMTIMAIAHRNADAIIGRNVP